MKKVLVPASVVGLSKNKTSIRASKATIDLEEVITDAIQAYSVSQGIKLNRETEYMLNTDKYFNDKKVLQIATMISSKFFNGSKPEKTRAMSYEDQDAYAPVYMFKTDKLLPLCIFGYSAKVESYLQ